MQNNWQILFDRRGFQTRLAKRLGFSMARINGWRSGIPVAYCIDVEKECEGEFTRLDFRSLDGALIWPEFAAAARQTNAEAVPA